MSPNTVSRKVIDDWVMSAVNEGYTRNPDYNGAGQEGHTMTARHELILSAGALASPQLMMVSGIGPAAKLAPHGIPVAHELQDVGENLQGHLQARPVYKCNVATINTEIGSRFKQAMITFQYALTRSGSMALAASLGTAFLKTRPDLETPDIQFHVQPFSANKVSDRPHKFSAFTASVLQLRPESSRHLDLKSADIADYPAIHPNYLETKTDCDTLVEGIRIARRISRCAPVRDLITAEYAPGGDISDVDYDGLLAWARNTATTIYHPTGTCKMGHDPLAVVDDRLRVHGIENLRIADASIMPVILSGDTNAPTIMIDEKASDMILEDAF